MMHGQKNIKLKNVLISEISSRYKTSKRLSDEVEVIRH